MGSSLSATREKGRRIKRSLGPFWGLPFIDVAGLFPNFLISVSKWTYSHGERAMPLNRQRQILSPHMTAAIEALYAIEARQTKQRRASNQMSPSDQISFFAPPSLQRTFSR
eukprot:TRINITY_DN6409_c0_g2_i1.p1 TRINITY_DN6409_c0_g2~~TRINITY_DN6409_c0_g2_i1.p1  ORF type:complete len:111 (+),score=13.71 TRINITY_DN6409_c0_g2_i1:484-816(+)